MVKVFQRSVSTSTSSCTATVAALIAAAFPALVTYLPQDSRLILHTVDSLRELKSRARGCKSRKHVAVRAEPYAGHPLMLSYPPAGQESDAGKRQRELWLRAERF